MSKKFHQGLHEMFILWSNFKWHKLLWWCSTLVHSYLHQSFPGYCFFIYDTDNIKKAWGHVCQWRCLVFKAPALLLKIINFWQMFCIRAGSLQEVNTLIYLLLSVIKSLINTHHYKHPLGRSANYRLISFKWSHESIPQPCFSRFYLVVWWRAFLFSWLLRNIWPRSFHVLPRLLCFLCNPQLKWGLDLLDNLLKNVLFI